ncbi:MerR family transcriptional regulator [Enterococcus sp. AZ109]|uniref:MerR family transcriptional regulator n=1 Tax=Enterococcus sp. AZ109 TaxID=2774634 RepID=UPI003F260E4D
MFYSIGKFATITGFTIDTLRYYEKEGIIQPKRDENNRRIFDDRDIAWLDFIRKLKMTGMKLKDIRLYAQLRYKGDETIQERLDLLFDQADLLHTKQQEIEDHLTFLQSKISIYQQMLAHKKETSES